MKKDVAEKWVAALRSGTYKKGEGRLRTNNDEFCCLGVLCDILDPEGWRRGIDRDGREGWLHRANAAYMLPKSIAEKARLDNVSEDEHGEVHFHIYPNYSITDLNDYGTPDARKGMPEDFTIIADTIEEAVAEGRI